MRYLHAAIHLWSVKLSASRSLLTVTRLHEIQYKLICRFQNVSHSMNNFKRRALAYEISNSPSLLLRTTRQMLSNQSISWLHVPQTKLLTQSSWNTCGIFTISVMTIHGDETRQRFRLRLVTLTRCKLHSIRIERYVRKEDRMKLYSAWASKWNAASVERGIERFYEFVLQKANWYQTRLRDE